MLTGGGRARAVELLRETGLLAQVLPEIAGSPATAQGSEPDMKDADAWRRTVMYLQALDRPTFPQALAVLLGWPRGAELVKAVAERWRLSNSEVERTGWLLRHGESLKNAAGQPWSRLQPVLVHRGIKELLQVYEVARRLRQSPTTRDALIVALTGYGQASDRQRGREAGFDEHLLKPVDPAVLDALIAGAQPRVGLAGAVVDDDQAAAPKATLYAFRRP